MRFLTILCTSLVGASSFVACLASGADLKWNEGTLEPESHWITVTSSAVEKDFLDAVPDLEKGQNWTITLQRAGQNPLSISLQKVAINIQDRGVYLVYQGDMFPVFDPADLPKGSLFVTFQGTKIIVTTGEAAHTKPTNSIVNGCFGWTLTKDKKKADVDITGGLQSGVGAKPQYNWSVKASCRVFGFGGRGFGEIDPSFTGEASQQNNADPDSLKAGITWRRLIAIPERRDGWIFSGDLLSYEFERSIKKEAVLDENGKPVDQQFLKKNTNLMWSGKAAYVSGWPMLNWTLTFAGFEAGKALSRTVKRDARSSGEQAVARLYFALDVYRTFFRKGSNDPIVTFHGNQILRLPFEQEPYAQADVNGGKMFLTNKPRHWSLVEMAFPLTNGVGINVQYKRGALPPSFEFVDHQVTIGFNLLLKHGS